MDWVFIGGYMHSGTTLVQKIISRNKVVREINGESKFFDFYNHYLGSWPKRFNLKKSEYEKWVVKIFQFTAEDKKSLIEIAHKNFENLNRLDNPLDLFKLTCEGLAQKENSQMVLEKTPNNIFHMDQIAQQFPGAKIVCVVRDLRAILSSKKLRVQSIDKNRYSPEDIEKKKLEKDYNLLADVISWKKVISRIRTAKVKNEHNIHIVKYESLVLDSEKEVNDLFDFLGLKFSSEVLKVDFFSHANIRNQKDKGIYTSSVQDWKKNLSDNEIELSQYLAKKELLEFNYPLIGKGAFKFSFGFQILRDLVNIFNRLIKRLKLLGFDGFVVYVRNIIKR